MDNLKLTPEFYAKAEQVAQAYYQSGHGDIAKCWVDATLDLLNTLHVINEQVYKQESNVIKLGNNVLSFKGKN